MRSIKLIDDNYHKIHNFREQICALYPVGVYDEKLTISRDLYQICTYGSASFDSENPGSDSMRAWQNLDELIDYNDCCGTFHTHPAGVDYFSSTDWKTYRGLARANGNKILYHGIQPCDSKLSRWIAMCMINHNIMVFNLGCRDINLNAAYFNLPYISVTDNAVNQSDITFINMHGD